MAFCTQCGSELQGAFCMRCGKPVAAATPAAAPERRKTSPIVWVLIVLLCLFGISIVGVIGTGAYVAHRLRRAGIDRELFERNPRLAVERMLEASHSGLEVVDTDNDTITIRNRRTGKRFTVTFDDARNGRFRLEGVDDEGRAGSFEIGGDAKIPSWVPQYPGSKPEPVFSARGESDEGAGEVGHFRFDTPDSMSDVIAFYERQARELGLTPETDRVGDGATVQTPDEGQDRTLKVIVARDDGRTTVRVTYKRKR